MAWFVTTVYVQGKSNRSEYAHERDAMTVFHGAMSRRKYCYAQVTIDHHERPPEEPGLATVGMAVSYLVVAQWCGLDGRTNFHGVA